ncbi:hypothetical protein ACTXPC_15440 [Brachybacterium alimentarium]|uniref:hypothetical protein n=1 Tax=Brachybacterium alimentarium TaxID=47845 RepID=UPI000DF41197|nr:hypothetical protein [Brachybacterium alimentarium]RCS74932.1 hypothetical protein CIK70_17530 [Brachybacterium alimentarium]
MNRLPNPELTYTGSLELYRGQRIVQLCGPCGCTSCKDRDDRRESGFTCEDFRCEGHSDDRFAGWVDAPGGAVYLTHIRRTSLAGL